GDPRGVPVARHDCRPARSAGGALLVSERSRRGPHERHRAGDRPARRFPLRRHLTAGLRPAGRRSGGPPARRDLQPAPRSTLVLPRRGARVPADRMSVSALTLTRPAPAPRTPRWVLIAVALFGVVVLGAVSAVGLPATVVLGLVAAAFLVVLRFPWVAISLFLTTFLINYPAAARGAGPITINNVLGLVLLALLLWKFRQHRDLWYVTDPFMRVLLVIGVIFIFGTAVSWYTLPDHWVQDPLTKPAWGGVKTTQTDFTGRFMFQFFSRIAFVTFVAEFVRTPRQLKWIWFTWLGCILAAVPPSLIGYAQSHEADFRVLTKVVNWADNANRFAFGLLLGIAFLYYLASTARSWRLRGVYALGMAALAPLILLSASRSGFLGM